MTLQFSKRSKKNYSRILSYLEEHFGELVALEFESKFKQFLNLLSLYPKIGTLEIAEKEIYGFQFSYQTKVFYRLKKNEIIVLTLFDVRQSEKKKRLHD